MQLGLREKSGGGQNAALPTFVPEATPTGIVEEPEARGLASPPDVTLSTTAPATVVVRAPEAGVRVRPGHLYDAVMLVASGTVLNVLGRDSLYEWVAVELEGRAGWIHASDVHMGASSLRLLPEMESGSLAPDTTLTATAVVTGNLVNLRDGPGTAYPIRGQVGAGDPLVAFGRNENGTWLHVESPSDPDVGVWIYGVLTDLDADMARLRLPVSLNIPPPPPPTPAPPPQASDAPQTDRAPPDGMPGALKSVAVGFTHACGIRPDDTLACWGGNHHGQSSPPAGTFLSVTAAAEFSCGLRTDGRAVCWGSASQLQPPNPDETFTHLESGGWFTCGIRPDQTLSCWDAHPRHAVVSMATVPGGTFQSMGAGNIHACAVRTDGTLTCWGRSDVYRDVPGDVATPPLGAFTSVSGGSGFACGIHAPDNSLVCWGKDEHGWGVTHPPAGSFKGVDLGLTYGCAVHMDGTLACWGENNEFRPPSGTFGTVSAGANMACAIRTDETPVCWKRNQYTH